MTLQKRGACKRTWMEGWQRVRWTANSADKLAGSIQAGRPTRNVATTTRVTFSLTAALAVFVSSAMRSYFLFW